MNNAMEKPNAEQLAALKALYELAGRPVLLCSNMEHRDGEYHTPSEDCPVLAKYRAAMRKARAAIRQAAIRQAEQP